MSQSVAADRSNGSLKEGVEHFLSDAANQRRTGVRADERNTRSRVFTKGTTSPPSRFRHGAPLPPVEQVSKSFWISKWTVCAGVDSDFQPVCAYPSVSELILLNGLCLDPRFRILGLCNRWNRICAWTVFLLDCNRFLDLCWDCVRIPDEVCLELFFDMRINYRIFVYVQRQNVLFFSLSNRVSTL